MDALPDTDIGVTITPYYDNLDNRLISVNVNHTFSNDGYNSNYTDTIMSTNMVRKYKNINIPNYYT